MNACPTPPTPGGSAVPRANVTSMSGQGAAYAEIGGRNGDQQAVSTATASTRANRRAFTIQC
jgi:hypothetical protein